jgi:macrolide phosphotransferase
MGKSPLILAALAKDAVPHIDFNRVKPFGGENGGEIESALLTSTTGDHYVIRIGSTESARLELAAEIGIVSIVDRAKLPFKVSHVQGETRDETGKPAIVFDFIYGNGVDIERVGPASSLARSIGESIAAIHSLDANALREAGLPEYSPADTARLRVAELDKIAGTGKVPSVLLDRWFAALEDMALFRFQPTPVHSNLSAYTVLELDETVSGILGWHGLKLGDPAEDFAWIAGTPSPELLDGIRFAYLSTRNVLDPNLSQRATLYSEIAHARWLMHGVTTGNQDIIDDAVVMLNTIADEVNEGIAPQLIAGAFVTASAVSAFVEAPAEPEIDSHIVVDDRTREIELPLKTDDELF